MGSESNVLMVIAPSNFREEELFQTKQAFDDEGIGVTIASTTIGECYGASGQSVEVDFELSQINAEDYQAVVFVGGPGTPQILVEESALSLARDFFKAGKIVAAICWAVAVLARSGILDGKKATIWPGAKEELISRGIVYTKEGVTVDGNIVTADGVPSADIFGMKIVEMIIK
ncbi:MAG: DJ-1/PfpI family protein [Candidatus Berkelbacteria bacterium]|nr:DJ-1/PfpI family protein [Candidatus Berkelbacteria bacterium]